MALVIEFEVHPRGSLTAWLTHVHENVLSLKSPRIWLEKPHSFYFDAADIFGNICRV